MKTNVHFPTDLSLLRDALHCVIRYSHKWATRFELSGWREYKSLCKKVNKACHAARKGRKKSYNHAKVNKYLRLGRRVREKVERGLLQPLEARFRVLDSRSKVEFLSWEEVAEKKALFTAIQEIYLFLDYMELFSDQIDRRILQGQKIPHKEKVFSVFKPFTRWIVKGKVGILCELMGRKDSERPLRMRLGSTHRSSVALGINAKTSCGNSAEKRFGKRSGID